LIECNTFHQTNQRIKLWRNLRKAMRLYIEYQVDEQGLESMNIIKRVVKELVDTVVDEDIDPPAINQP